MLLSLEGEEVTDPIFPDVLGEKLKNFYGQAQGRGQEEEFRKTATLIFLSC